ncbi:putative TonB-dependent receptor [Imperialibacter sp. EC-SDR9]|nr:putative TonB-dependent receptor [Imperialibacter sp. 75]CAD5295875.1 putative TonB-dependent receptor [Imperialibacter sp. 89]VVT11699.1 putative TonB-dependent receptor [Imperialibacter sp. EC-SDR9]
MPKMYKSLLFCICLLMSLPAWSQEQWEEAGEIQEAEVVIEKDREIVLPFQPRSFEKIPPVAIETGGIKQEYVFPALDVTVPPTTVDIKALKLQAEPLEKYYGNLVKLGYGNYNSPLGELYLYNKRNKQYLAGFQAKHLSFGKGPVDGRNSASGETLLKGEASYFGDGFTASGDAYYKLSRFNFYGYDPSVSVTEGEDSLKRNFNKYGVSVNIDNSSSESDISISGGLAYNGQSDNLDISENWVKVNADLSMELQSALTGHVGVFADLIGYKDSLSTSRQRIGLEPSVVYTGDNYQVSAGIRYVYQSDSLVPASQVYPVLKGKYQFGKSFGIFGELSGNSQLNTWQGMSARNPYLAQGVDIHNSNNILNLGLGAQGNLAFMSYKVGLSQKVFKQFGVFLNSPDDPSKFILAYDTANFKVLDLYMASDFYLGSSINLGLQVNYYNYSSDTFEEAWHMPGYRIAFNGSFLAFNKMRTKAGLAYLGGIKAYDWNLGQSEELKAATDVYIDLDYLLSERATIFLQFHNLANQQYQLLSNYPVRGLTFKAGFSYSF